MYVYRQYYYVYMHDIHVKFQNNYSYRQYIHVCMHDDWIQTFSALHSPSALNTPACDYVLLNHPWIPCRQSLMFCFVNLANKTSIELAGSITWTCLSPTKFICTEWKIPSGLLQLHMLWDQHECKLMKTSFSLPCLSNGLNIFANVSSLVEISCLKRTLLQQRFVYSIGRVCKALSWIFYCLGG